MTEGAGRFPKNVLTRQKLLYPVPGSQTMSMIVGKRGRATSGISDEQNTGVKFSLPDPASRPPAFFYRPH